MRWFIVQADGSNTSGPFDADQIRSMARIGLLTHGTLLRREDQSEPITASRIRGLLPVTETRTRHARRLVWASAAGLGALNIAGVILWSRTDPSPAPQSIAPGLPATGMAEPARPPANVQPLVPVIASTPPQPMATAPPAEPPLLAPFILAPDVSVSAVATTTMFVSRPSRQDIQMRMRVEELRRNRPPTGQVPPGPIQQAVRPYIQSSEEIDPGRFIQRQQIRLSPMTGFLVALRLHQPVGLAGLGTYRVRCLAADGALLRQSSLFAGVQAGYPAYPGQIDRSLALLGIVEPIASTGLPAALADLSFGNEMRTGGDPEVRALGWIVPTETRILQLERDEGGRPAILNIAVTPPYSSEQIAAARERRLGMTARSSYQPSPAGGGQVEAEVSSEDLVLQPDDVVLRAGALIASWCLAGDGSTLIVRSRRNRLLSIDLAGRRLIAQCELGDRACLFAAGGDRVVLADPTGGKLRVADTATLAFAELGMAPLDRRPQDIAMGCGDRSRAAVLYEDGTIELRDTGHGRVIGSLATPRAGAPARLLASPGLRYICVASASAPCLVDVQEGGWTVLPAGAEPLAVTDDGQLIYRTGAVASARSAPQQAAWNTEFPQHQQGTTVLAALSPRFRLMLDREQDALSLVDNERSAVWAQLGTFPCRRGWRASVESTALCWPERDLAGFLVDDAVVLRRLGIAAATFARRGGIADVLTTIDLRIGRTQVITDPLWPAAPRSITAVSLPKGVTLVGEGRLAWDGIGARDGVLPSDSIRLEITAEQERRTLTIPVRILPMTSDGVTARLVDGSLGASFVIDLGAQAAGEAPQLLHDARVGMLLALAGDRIHRFGRGMQQLGPAIVTRPDATLHRADAGLLLSCSPTALDVHDTASGALRRSIPWNSGDGIIADCALDGTGQVAWLAAGIRNATQALDQQRILRVDLRSGAIARIADACGGRVRIHPDGWLFTVANLPAGIRRTYLDEHFTWDAVAGDAGQDHVLLRYAIDGTRLVAQDCFALPFGLPPARSGESDFAMTVDGALFWLRGDGLLSACSARPTEPGPIHGLHGDGGSLRDIPGTAFLITTGARTPMLINRLSGAIIARLPIAPDAAALPGTCPTPDGCGLIFVRDPGPAQRAVLEIYPHLLTDLGIAPVTLPPAERLVKRTSR